MDRGCPIKPLKPVGAAGREIGDPAAGERGCKGVVCQCNNHFLVGDSRAGRAVNGHIAHGRRGRGCGGVVHRERITQIPFTVQSYCHTVIADIQMSDVPGVIVVGAENVLIGGRRRSG